MIYPVKTLSQLPLLLKGFRKEQGLTQAAVAERLGISQQSYAYFEANPATATFERLFLVLRMLDVEISLDRVPSSASEEAEPSVKSPGKRSVPVQAIKQKLSKRPGAVAKGKSKSSALAKAGPVVAPTRKKERW